MYQILVKIGKNDHLEAYTSKTKKIRVCYHKTKLLSAITYPLTIKIKTDNTVYANVSDLPRPTLHTSNLRNSNMFDVRKLKC